MRLKISRKQVITNLALVALYAIYASLIWSHEVMNIRGVHIYKKNTLSCIHISVHQNNRQIKILYKVTKKKQTLNQTINYTIGVKTQIRCH